MGQYSSGNMKPRMAVLGLLAQGRTTAVALARSIEQEFPHANFAPNSAHSNLPRLADGGQARLVEQGQQTSLDVYEITDLGLREFQEWLYEVAIVPLPLRDPLYGKLVFIGPSRESVGRLIKIVELFESATQARFGSEQGKINTLNIRGVKSPRVELQRIGLTYTAARWGGEARRLTALREGLEEFHAKLPEEAGE